MILLSSLSEDIEIGDIVISNIFKSIGYIGKCMIYRIIYFGIFYLCVIKRENGGWKLKYDLLIGECFLEYVGFFV